jgi:hypothetical protein
MHRRPENINSESYAGEKLIKLPGGGLEFGEGIMIVFTVNLWKN